MKVFQKYFDLETKEADGNIGIKILNLGHYIHPKNKAYPVTSHPDSYLFEWEKGRSLEEYQILYIAEGQGYFEANGMKPILIESGTVILLYPGVWHRYRPKEDIGWEEYWIGFNGNYAQYLLEQECFSSQNPIIKVGFNVELMETFSKLFLSAETEDDSYRKFSSFLLIQLLGIVYASALLTKGSKTKKQDLIDIILNEIHLNWNQKIDLEELALKNGVSYVWFRKSFKEITGTSPNQYQLMLKIRKTEQLIQETSLTLSEIAFKSGFESESYFSRIFKQKMGYNPSKLRKSKV